MAKPGRKLALTPALAKKITDFLSDGSAPFLALAAERAGISRNTAQAWVEYGDSHDDCPLRASFAQDVRRIRAEFMAQLSRDIQAADRNTSEAARQKQWLLQRLDQENFYLATKDYKKEQPQAAPPVPENTSPEAMKKVEEDLAKPETLQ